MEHGLMDALSGLLGDHYVAVVLGKGKPVLTMQALKSAMADPGSSRIAREMLDRLSGLESDCGTSLSARCAISAVYVKALREALS